MGTADRDKFVTEDTFTMECYKLECEKFEVCSIDGCANEKQVELTRLENNSKEKRDHSCLSSSPPGQETDSNYDRFMVEYRNGMRYMQCDKCTFVCRPAISIFSNHYRLHDTDDSFEANISAKNVFQCKLCNRMFADQSTLIEHTATKHDQVCVFKCKKCDLKFNTKLEFRSHIRSHKILRSSTKAFQCDFCGKEFKTRSGYINHRTNVCVQYSCDLCDETFLIKTLLLDHSKKVHNVQIIEPSSEVQQKVPSFSVCPICGKSISKTAINRHIQLHSEEKPYICDLCGKQFRFKWSLREHIMVEIGMKDFVCEICGKKFVIQAYLNKHMRFHMMCDGKFEGYQCEICGKKYAEEWRVKEHQRNTHHKRSPPHFKCDICDKKYSRRWLVRSHRRLAHEAFDSLQEYQCEHCGKKFAEKWMIKLHLQTLHNVCCGQQDETDKVVLPIAEEFLTRVEYNNFDNTVESELITRSQEDTVEEKGQKHEKKTFECELCKKSFATKQGMKNHLYAELNLRKYACDICGKRYNWWMGLKEHLIMNHGEKEFVCNVCEKDFPTKKRYQDHMSVHSNSRPYECGCGNSFKLRRYLAKHQKRSCKMFKMTNT